ncbi:MAG: FAD-dependent oxidoreductase [bacterium]
MAKAKVFSPIEIGSMTLDHRIVMAPTVHEMCYDGLPTEAHLAINETYARGGASMVCVGGANIDPDPAAEVFPGVLSIADDRSLFGLWRLAETIKIQGARACAQIYHGGRGVARYGYQRTGKLPLGVSSKVPFMGAAFWEFSKDQGRWSVAQVIRPTPVRELTGEEIDRVVKLHALAVLRAQRAGFDAVNIHFANVTLIMDFMSPHTNVRSDAYGGSWENRMRLPCEILQAARAAAGRDYPLIVRIPGDQGIGEAGIRIDDVVKEIVPRLEEAGADAIDLSAGILDLSPHYIIPSMYAPRGCYLHHGEAVKKMTKLPVLVAGRLCDPRLIVKAVEDGRCDIAALARPIMADPDLPRKMLEGRYDDVRMCVACGYCMTPSAWGRLCAINPELSRELLLSKVAAAGTVKKVLVAGSGPAGMEAARVLAMRGHKVTLCEKEKEPGGLLRVASASPLTREWQTFTRWHVGQLRKLGVEIRLGTEVTPAVVEELKPDAAVVATGSSPARDVKGGDLPIVVPEDEALLKKAEAGARVVVLGGAFWDVETALKLAGEGRQVTLVREAPALGLEGLGLLKGFPITTKMLPESGVKLLLGTRVEEVEERGVRVRDGAGRISFIEADTVVLAGLRKRNPGPANEVRALVAEVYEIGDCRKPHNVADAVYQGRLIGGKI